MIQDQPNRLDRIESILAGTATQQANNTEAIAQLGSKLDQLSENTNQLTSKLDRLSDNMDQLTSNVDRVLARSAVLDDVLLELRDGFEQHQRNFEQHQRTVEENQRAIQENQRTTNAALQSLEAILLQLVRRGQQ